MRALEKADVSIGLLADSNTVGVILLDRLSRLIREANEFFLNMLRYNRSDLPLHWGEVIPPEWHGLDQANRQELRSKRVTTPFEIELVAGDGRRVPAALRWASLRGNQRSCVGTVVDLSDQRSTKEVGGQTEEYYPWPQNCAARDICEMLPLMSFVLDADGIILRTNPYGARVLARSQEELVGRPFLALCSEEDRQATRERFRFSREHIETVSRCTSRKLRTDGSVVWVEEAIRAVESQSGEMKLLVACHDLTEQRKVEQEVSDYDKRLRDLTMRVTLAEERERRKISQGLHDCIGQNLAMANLEISQLQEGEHSPEKLQRLRRVKKLIRETSQASRSLTFELSSPVLYELGLEAALRSLVQGLSAESGVHFQVRTDQRPKPLSHEMSVVLFRSVRELVRNILDHSHANDAIIKVSRVGDRIQITVEDDGMGFDAAKLNSLILAGHYGLFSIREQLSHFGGHMQVESRPRKGTRVLLQAPFEQPTDTVRSGSSLSE